MRLSSGTLSGVLAVTCSTLLCVTDAFVVRRQHALGRALRVGGERETDIGGMPAPKYVPKEGDFEADERSQGGSRFREMMEQSQSAGRRPRPQPAAVAQEDPYDSYAHQPQPQVQVQPPPPPPPGVPLPPGWASTVDPTSGRMYYYNQVTQETSWTPPPMPPPPPPPMPPQGQAQAPTPQSRPRVVRSGPSGDPTDTGGDKLRVPTLEEQFRDNIKSGRRELDTINSSADVYLAQLKRDTTIRKIAQMNGDMEAANEVFADSSIQQLEGWLVENPHRKDEDKELWAMVGASEDEQVGFFDEPDDGMTVEERKSYSGISYKEKMAEMKARKQKKNGS